MKKKKQDMNNLYTYL